MEKLGQRLMGRLLGRQASDGGQEKPSGEQAEDSANPPRVPESRDGFLQYLENGLIVRIYLKEGVTRVGRSRHMDYSVRSPSVSRAHAEFVRRNGRYFVRDTHSTCGTYLNGSHELLAEDQEVELRAKDEICLGNVKMTFLLRNALAEETRLSEADILRVRQSLEAV